jgi:hypothetical protein
MEVLLIHQLPLEMYPPAVNLLRTLQKEFNGQVAVVTCSNQRGLPEALIEQCSIYRIRFGRATDSFFARIFWSLLWHWRAAWICRRLNPRFIISVEPHSALAAWIWLKFLWGHSRLLIHHHEYYSPDDYLRPGNRLTRLNRWFEQQLLRQAAWVSQTNADRLRLFRQDHPELTDSQCHILPNYPPAEWHSTLALRTCWPRSGAQSLRLVYVGSVSLHDTWIGPLVEWLNSNANTRCTLDIYCYNLDSRTRSFLEQNSGHAIIFHSRGVEYDKLPLLLTQFDVGLILYRCNTVNFTYNASNKLFEYLLCGLDVWYPPCMLGVKPYSRSDAVPRVLETNFEKLGQMDLGARSSRDGLPWQPWTETCEEVFAPIVQLMKQDL